MATPRKYLPDGSSPPKGRPKGMDTLAAYAKVPDISRVDAVKEEKPEPREKARSKARSTLQLAKRVSGAKPSGESMAQREAFEAYLAMGDSRSLKALSSVINTAESTLEGWSKRYEWVKRVIEREERFADTIAIEPVAEQQEKRKFGLRLIDKILRNAVTLNEDGSIMTCTIEAKSPSDVRTLLVLREELLNPDKGSKTFGKGSQINAENAVFIIKK